MIPWGKLFPALSCGGTNHPYRCPGSAAAAAGVCAQPLAVLIDATHTPGRRQRPPSLQAHKRDTQRRARGKLTYRQQRIEGCSSLCPAQSHSSSRPGSAVGTALQLGCRSSSPRPPLPLQHPTGAACGLRARNGTGCVAGCEPGAPRCTSAMGGSHAPGDLQSYHRSCVVATQQPGGPMVPAERSGRSSRRSRGGAIAASLWTGWWGGCQATSVLGTPRPLLSSL